MTNLAIIKGTVHIVSMLGVQKVVSDVIRNNTVVLTTVDKVLVTTGSLVAGSMIGQAASTHVVELMDKVEGHFNRFDKSQTEQ